MKKIILLILLMLDLATYSQISLDFQNTIFNFSMTRLSNSVSKYFDESQIIQNYQVPFYNLDGTFYKTIQIPHDQSSGSEISQIGYFTSTLFDTDPSNIEYIVQYMWDSCNNCNQLFRHVKVIREDGSVLLDEMNAGGFMIYNTEEGAKLMMKYQYSNFHYYQTKVFSLPGEFPTGLENVTSYDNPSPILYPNPNGGSFFIDFKNVEGTFSTIDLFSFSGKLINSYISNKKITLINNPGLSNGIYILKSKSNGINGTNKLIIEK